MVYRNKLMVRMLPVLCLCLLLPHVSIGKTLVGVIFSGNIPYYRSMHVAFLAELQNKLPEASDIKYVVQFPSPDPVAWSNTAKKLIVGEVDMIISYGFPATSAVIAKESTIPLMFVGVYDPESVIVQTGPVTGCGYTVSLPDLFRYLKQGVVMKRLAVVYGSNEADSVRQMNELASLAAQEKVELLRLDLSSRGDLDKFNALETGDAVFITGSSVAHVLIKDILTILREKKIPAVDIFPSSPEEGIIGTLHQNPEQQGRIAAEIAAKLIAGEKAGNIEPVIVSSPELVFNLNEARRLGISFSSQVLGEATRVIQ